MGKKKKASDTKKWSEEGMNSELENLREEMDSLFHYYHQMMDEKIQMDGEDISVKSCYAVMIEEQDLPLSKLVEQIYNKRKEKDGSITRNSVQNFIGEVGIRISYGIKNEDPIDVEDETEKSLWCWETRNVKLIPESHRGIVQIRRYCRNKIRERITAVLGMMNALERSLIHYDPQIDLIKEPANLLKTSSEGKIRLLVQKRVERNTTKLAEKAVKLQEKLKERERKKELEKKNLEDEKERRQIEKEKRLIENERMRLQKEATKKLTRFEEQEKKKAEKKFKVQSKINEELGRLQKEAAEEEQRKEKEKEDLRKKLEAENEIKLLEFSKKIKDSSSSAKVLLPTVSDTSIRSSSYLDDTSTTLPDYSSSENYEAEVDTPPTSPRAREA